MSNPAKPIKKPGPIPPEILEKIRKAKKGGVRVRVEPDYTAPAEEHREELRSQAEMVDYTVEAEEHREELRSQKDVTEPVDYEALYRHHVLHETDRPPVGSTAYKIEEARRRFREYTPKKWSLVWGIIEAVKAEEKFFQGLKVKGEVASGKAQAEAEKAKLEGKDVLAGAKYAEALAITWGKSIIGTTSVAVRPNVWVHAPGAIVDLLAYPEKRALIKQQIVGDPARAIMGLGGALTGMSLLNEISSSIKTKMIESKAKKIPSEAFYISDPESRLMEYPIPVTDEVTNYLLEQTTVPKSGLESPATLIERGKWPKGWGGTSVIMKEDSGLAEIMQPIPFTEIFEGHLPGMDKITAPVTVGPQSSNLGYLGLLGGLKSERDLLDMMEKDILQPSTETKDWLWDRPTPDIPPPRHRTREIIEPVLGTREGFLPIQEPVPDEIIKQRPRGPQSQLPKLSLPTPGKTLLPPPPQITRKTRTKIPRFEDPLKLMRRKGRSKRIGGWININPIQEDPLKSVSKLEKDLFGPKKKGKKKGLL